MKYETNCVVNCYVGGGITQFLERQISDEKVAERLIFELAMRCFVLETDSKRKFSIGAERLPFVVAQPDKRLQKITQNRVLFVDVGKQAQSVWFIQTK